MAEIKFSCPFCGQNVQCDPSQTGMQIHCPTCKEAITVPPTPAASTVPAKSSSWRNLLILAAALVVFAGLAGIWVGYSKYKLHSKQTHLPSGLVALWSGEGNAKDGIGGADGELAGDATYEKGKVGQAFSFDGTRDTSVNVGNPVQLQLQDFTIAAWIKRNNPQSVSADFPRAVIFGYGLGGYALYFNSTGVPILSKYNVRGGETKAHTAIKDTDWHHLVVAKSGTAVIFYVDGVPHPAAAAKYDAEFDFTTDAAIGASGQYSVLNFWGLIDEVAIYNRALSAAEIREVYTAQK
jgi:DNA-directed RNA polymerase subunit RPC12/RpoP